MGAKQQATDSTQAALQTARTVVQQRWPEFADVDPQVTQRTSQPLHPADAGRLGVGHATARAASVPEYTFTFLREISTPEGHVIPRVARITVDAHQRVVKAVLSK